MRPLLRHRSLRHRLARPPQQAVADEMGFARTTLVAVEKGECRVTPEEMIRLAALYGRPVSDFVSRQIVTAGFVP